MKEDLGEHAMFSFLILLSSLLLSQHPTVHLASEEVTGCALELWKPVQKSLGQGLRLQHQRCPFELGIALHAGP